MVDLMRFRNQFDDAYRKIYGEVPTEGEDGFKQMTASFLMSWLLYKEAYRDGAQEEREACLKLCDPVHDSVVAELIRARGKE